MLKVYFNPRCSKCRIAELFLLDNRIEHKNYLYLEEGLSKEEILELLSKGLELDEIIRKNEPEYKEIKDLDDDKKIEALVKNPRLLQRPIIVSQNKAIVGRESQNLNKIKEWKGLKSL